MLVWSLGWKKRSRMRCVGVTVGAGWKVCVADSGGAWICKLGFGLITEIDFWAENANPFLRSRLKDQNPPRPR